MTNVVMGKVVDTYFKIVSNMKTININDENVSVFEKKPELIKEEKIREWREICRFEGEVRYNQDFTTMFAGFRNYKINISELEEVLISKIKMRADLGEYHLCSDKILEETDINKEIMEEAYEKLLGDYNYNMITSDDKMKDYCELHGLDMRKADCEKVFSLVYPNEIMKIVDGKIAHFTKGEYVIKNGYGICNTYSDSYPVHDDKYAMLNSLYIGKGDN